ncbi:phosphotransferase enzyme family protein [Aureibacillus halotolerans]|uniref:Ser/Thr protein kinase RdoA (MazF antagonist) n=1 Tax=Aureibacillus halotolerans TaxID=1508390 RepID=A0A4R6UAM2_9BACI|nr:phosphotransferase [Aureibacillus halotolerans]TDQ42906.1 Ser/Thr protein kinase RdoA (MazF antagonist) [Aureibacillus halotolerans]
MNNEDVLTLLRRYPVKNPKVTFLRHNENRTYRVDDEVGNRFLLRVHEPFREGMRGLQHSAKGLFEELTMLEALQNQGTVLAQKPLRNNAGELITTIEENDKQNHCSLLTWLEGRDVLNEDLDKPELAKTLGHELANLHAFFRTYPHSGMAHRPSQGLTHNLDLVSSIQVGHRLGLFTDDTVETVDQTIRLINSRLEAIKDDPTYWGLIHGDLVQGNILLSPEGKLSFIDYGFWGSGFYLTDVAMGALLLPFELRDMFVQSYLGQSHVTEEILLHIEGLMICAIIGFYTFQMDNENVHAGMKEKLPRQCRELFVPFLQGERIFYHI